MNLKEKILTAVVVIAAGISFANWTNSFAAGLFMFNALLTFALIFDFTTGK